MKKTNKPEIGKLTVIKPRRRRSQEPRPEVGIVEEVIGAIHGAIEAGKTAHRIVLEAGQRVHRVINKIRGK